MDISITVVPSFSGLRRFPKGRGFTQWTGDDSKALMKVSTLRFQTPSRHWQSQKGLFAGHRGTRPWWNRAHVSGISQVLLPCAKGCNHRPNASGTSWCTFPIPPASQDIPYTRCPPRWIFSSLSTLPCPLWSSHQAIRCSKRPLYINYRIKTYQGGEGAMEAFQ